MRILLVDDHAMFRHSLAFLLSSVRPDVVIDQTASVDQALQILTSLGEAPDLAILDLHLAGHSPLDGLALFRTKKPNVPVVVVSADENPSTIQACIDLGAFSYVPKSADIQQLTLAIERILGGGVWLPQTLLLQAQAQKILNVRDQTPLANSDYDQKVLAKVTRRQKDVLLRVVQGMTNKAIGRELNISDGTVKTHLAHLMSLFKTANRTQLVFELARLGIRLDNESEEVPF